MPPTAQCLDQRDGGRVLAIHDAQRGGFGGVGRRLGGQYVEQAGGAGLVAVARLSSTSWKAVSTVWR
jgi:DNA-binding IclR family transcriptional regulator